MSEEWYIVIFFWCVMDDCLMILIWCCIVEFVITIPACCVMSFSHSRPTAHLCLPCDALCSMYWSKFVCTMLQPSHLYAGRKCICLMCMSSFLNVRNCAPQASQRNRFLMMTNIKWSPWNKNWNTLNVRLFHYRTCSSLWVVFGFQHHPWLSTSTMRSYL